jgi:hypothetical protein
MIASLQEVDALISDQVNDPMLLRQTTRPRASRQILQRFWLADSGEWITYDCLDQIERAQGNLAVGCHPVL